MTEHCECGAPPDDGDEHHDCVAITEPEPLRVRVARALGCRVVVALDISGGMARKDAPETIYACGCAGSAWHCACEDAGHYRYACAILPYGDDTPEGWACTRPLIARFRLSFREVPGGGMDVWSEIDGRPDVWCSHNDRCRGAAEWVAEHGAAAIAEEMPPGHAFMALATDPGSWEGEPGTKADECEARVRTHGGVSARCGESRAARESRS